MWGRDRPPTRSRRAHRVGVANARATCANNGGDVGAEGARRAARRKRASGVHPAHRVQAVDTTGAGDRFVGAFVTALRQAFPPESALRFANAAAALSVQTEGASLSMPTRQAIEAFLHS
ncbi:MAG UNVERIFIED_CONTAM: PfkB family carbohydrate kinase [Anaerolineae bacterium]